jgi:hypothetical protein
MAESGRLENACEEIAGKTTVNLATPGIVDDPRTTHRHADERIGNTRRSSQRMAQQPVQVIDGVKQSPVHVHLEGCQVIRLSRLVV